MILRPCKKCIVGPVCKEACGQIRFRTRLSSMLETFLGISSFSAAILIILIMFTGMSVRDSYILVKIILALFSYAVLSFIISAAILKPRILKVYERFNEIFPTGHPYKNPYITIGIPPPPPPPRKRYLKY